MLKTHFCLHRGSLSTVGKVCCRFPCKVLEWRKAMGLPDDDVAVFADQWGLRRMFSLGIRRRGAPRKQKDLMVEGFFETLCRYWGTPPSVAPRPAKRGKGKEDRAAEEDVVDQDGLSDTEISEGLRVILLRQDAQYPAAPEEAWSSSEATSPSSHASAKEDGPSESCEAELAKKNGPSEIELAATEGELDDAELEMEEHLLMEKIRLLTNLGGSFEALLYVQATDGCVPTVLAQVSPAPDS